jgi:chromate transporter
MNDSAANLVGLFTHFLVLSLLAVGGAITTVPDMHRYIVTEQHWLSDAQFTASIAIAQAAPGPNVLFVAVLGILLPSTALSLWATRWGTQRRETRGVRAFTAGLAPLTIGLLLSTGWVLAEPYLREPAHRWGALALVALSVLVMMRSKLSPMWLVAIGSIAGALGWV